MTDQRKHMNPDNLDILLFLKYNRDRWNLLAVQTFLNQEIEENSSSASAPAPSAPAPSAPAPTVDPPQTNTEEKGEENDEEEY